MSADHTHDDHKHHPVSFYLGVAAVLTVLTFIEIGPLFEWYDIPIPALMALSAVKFVLVVALFMHLWDDDNVYTQIFTPALLGSVLMVGVLMVLHSAVAPSPGEDSIPVQERYWTDYSGECTSWVRSHVSNRWYCTSPPIPRDRLAMYNQPAGGAGGASMPKIDVASMSDDEAKAQLIEAGKGLYEAQCAACHQATGAGIPGVFPPLAGSDYKGFLDPVEHARTIVKGLTGEIVVNGTTYNGAMTPFGQLSDLEIAAIATYERNSWGNDHGMVTPEQVASVR